MPAVRRLEWYGDRYLDTMERQLDGKLQIIALAVAKEARDSMGRPKSGKEVPVGKKLYSGKGGKKRIKGFGTRRSAPGEPPAAQSAGAGLQGSIQTDKPGHLMRRVGTSLDYGLYLELGTRKMRPRPYLRPALDAVRPQAERILRR